MADGDGRLMQGDQILQVNQEDMRNCTQEQAAAILKVSRKPNLFAISMLKQIYILPRVKGMGSPPNHPAKGYNFPEL